MVVTNARIRLARIAESILSNPEERFEASFDEIMNEAKSQDAATRKDALLTATLVLTDILPNYKPTSLEGVRSDDKSSKALKSVQAYENKLQAALKQLVRALKTGNETKGLCLLLSASNPIIQAICGDQLVHAVLAAAARGDAVAKDCISRVFENDVDLDTTREVVKAIAAEKSPVRLAEMLCLLEQARTDLSLSIVGSASMHAFQPKKMDDAEAAEFRRDLLASSTERDMHRLKKNEAAILSDCVVVYVKIMRAHHLHTPKVLRAALLGLKKKAAQVNIELMVDIVKELNVLATVYLTKGKATVEDNELGLLMANTVFALVRGRHGKGVVEDLTGTLTMSVIPKIADHLAVIDSSILIDFVNEISKCEVSASACESVARIMFESIMLEGASSRPLSYRLIELYSKHGEEMKANLDRDETFSSPSLFWCTWLMGHHTDDITRVHSESMKDFSHDFQRKKRKINNTGSEGKRELTTVLEHWITSHT